MIWQKEDYLQYGIGSDVFLMLKQIEIDNVLDELLHYFIHVERQTLLLVQRGIKPRKVLLDAADRYLADKELAAEDRITIIKHLSKFIWGYYILEEVISDPDVSDIKVLSADNVRVKRKGKRMGCDIRFPSNADYKRFVSMAAVKNKTNLADVNAIQSFTDKESNKDFILRFNISTEFVNSTNAPYMHIRKIPKKKHTLSELTELGMLDEDKAEYLRYAAKESSGILFAGKGASGKTTLMNALLEHIPHDRSGLVIQENEELFSNIHPDLMFQHIVSAHGEGKIKYDLKDLSRNGLLTDLDYFIIGEIKGGEALYLLNAGYTGHKCWASLHAMSSSEAIDKLADYVKYESDYSLNDIRKMLMGMKTIVYMKDFCVREISEVREYKGGELIYERIF